MNVLKTVALRKPVVVMKAGKYAVSSKAAQSHTGSLAGRSEIYEAAMRQAGRLSFRSRGASGRGEDPFHACAPAGRKVAVLSFQAGPGILLTDEVARSGLAMATFSSRPRTG